MKSTSQRRKLLRLLAGSLIVGGVLLQALVHPAYAAGAWIAGIGVLILIVLYGLLV